LSTPIDAAFSVLKPEEEVRKIFPVAAALPYVIPAAAAIYGGIQGAKNVRENKVTDPVLGTELAEGDDSFLSNLGEFGTGLAQGFVPGVGAKAGARYAGKKALAAGAAKQAPKKVAAKRSADKARAAQQQRMSARAQRDELNRLHTTPMVQGSRGQRLHQQRMADLNRQVASNRPELLFDDAANAAALARRTGAGNRFAGNMLTGLGKPMGPRGLGFVGAGLATGGGLAYAGHQIGQGLDGMFAAGGGGSGMGGGGSGMGGQQHQQGQFGLGQQSGGIQGVNNVGTTGVDNNKIFDQVQGSNFGNKQKGEIMTFTNKEGNEMLLKTLELFEKASCGTEHKSVCPKCGKANCKCDEEKKAECPKCGKNCKCDEEKKADDGDKKKKPAHGMVIVIGSKNSGPGPSTEGKRDSKD
tara:strand:- start:7709 stop:8944 length:1236 start_codon:yes stop_codon:yes gene_type:complete